MSVETVAQKIVAEYRMEQRFSRAKEVSEIVFRDEQELCRTNRLPSGHDASDFAHGGKPE